MTTYGYIRISSKDQKPDRQIDAFKRRGIRQANIFLDKVSGKNFERPAYRKMVKKAMSGDLIVITSIDRLGRNYKEILEQWREITKQRGIDIEVLDMPLLNTAIEHNGLTGVFISDLVLQILAYVAETERAFIKKRQSEGIMAAKARGVCFGRTRLPDSDMFEKAYMLWKKSKLTSREAAKYAEMSHSTFYRRCKERLSLE